MFHRLFRNVQPWRLPPNAHPQSIANHLGLRGVGQSRALHSARRVVPPIVQTVPWRSLSASTSGDGLNGEVVHVKHKNGAFWLPLPMKVGPDDESKQVVNFLISHDSKVEDIVEQIQNQITSIRNRKYPNVSLLAPKISLLHSIGQFPYPQDAFMGGLLTKDRFDVKVDGNVFHAILPTHQLDPSHPIEDSRMQSTTLPSEVVDMQNHSPQVYIREQLALLDDEYMNVADFVEFCATNGTMDNHQALDTLAKFRDAGVVLHFPDASDPTVRDRVFLRPSLTIAQALGSLGMDTHQQCMLRADLDAHRVELEAIIEELSPMYKLKQDLDKHAHRVADFGAWFGVLSLVSSSGLYWYLSYVHFSWDVMEPVTYFTFNFFSIVAYFWWWRTNTKYNYPDLRNVFTNQRRERLYRRGGLDMARFEELVQAKRRVRAKILDLEGKVFLD